ncbi:acyltransferase family protein [Lapidilactobacillus wuchangensis]|uniref:acyltransferase family protein n=1 Tax=Lapidilactobacillus wuchangensis TaxID=2486001 RepID=UPI000F7B19ED|nr:acyltransferase [Lapidilactobacillus wuchangensis]
MKSQIDQSLETRKNNFDLIRFFAAILVVWFHSFPLTGVGNEHEIISRMTRMQTTAGAVGVMVFFIISGFLITMSFDRTKDLGRFLKARVLRIMPAYIVVILLSIFVLGPLLTTLPINKYFAHPETRQYFINLSLKNMRYTLPGVFNKNIYPNAINGSIWTLWYEFVTYLVVALLGITKLLRKETSVVLYLVCLGLIVFHYPNYYYYFYFGLFFSAGMIFYQWREKIILNGKLAIVAVLILIAGVYFKQVIPAASIGGSYLIFYLALGPVPKFPNFTKYGDLSYGIYIYSFVIQQALMSIFSNNLSQMENFLLAVPLSMAFAFASWHLIEKRCIKLKNQSIFGFLKRNTQSGN